MRCDQIIRFARPKAQAQYPMPVRRIKFVDLEAQNTYVFLTNNFEIDAEVIALLYKKRWNIELFFKWVKQHLRIKAFWGENQNAVYTQIWVAVCNYALIHSIKNQLNLEYTPYQILEILSDSIFEQIPTNQLLMNLK